jgi:hypothetical protein
MTKRKGCVQRPRRRGRLAARIRYDACKNCKRCVMESSGE